MVLSRSIEVVKRFKIYRTFSYRLMTFTAMTRPSSDGQSFLRYPPARELVNDEVIATKEAECCLSTKSITFRSFLTISILRRTCLTIEAFSGSFRRFFQRRQNVVSTNVTGTKESSGESSQILSTLRTIIWIFFMEYLLYIFHLCDTLNIFHIVIR